MDHDKEPLIQRIIALELAMFQQVRAREKAWCQEEPAAFRLMREMGHRVLSGETLASYRDDLEAARRAGRNLMTEKYARMENLIPPLRHAPPVAALIGEIVAIEAQWMQELAQRFPDVITGGGGVAFRNYLACELETLSDTTLALYHRDVCAAHAAGTNLAEEGYTWLFLKLGYASLAEVQALTAGAQER